MRKTGKDWVGHKFKDKSRFLYELINILGTTLRFISRGKIGDSEYMIVLKKKAI